MHHRVRKQGNLSKVARIHQTIGFRKQKGRKENTCRSSFTHRSHI